MPAKRKLNPEQWAALRAKREQGASYNALAKECGVVSSVAIFKHAKRNGWADPPAPPIKERDTLRFDALKSLPVIPAHPIKERDTLRHAYRQGYRDGFRYGFQDGTPEQP